MRVLKPVLEQEGWQVLTAPNGLEGLRRARKERLDFVILDVLLPGLDGFEVCHRLRTDPQTARLPLLILSAKAHEVDRATGLKVGADDYLTKPANPSEMKSRVKTLLTRKAAIKFKTVTFLGSKGGVGTTTVAVNVSIALSQNSKRVVLFDPYPHRSTVAAQLNLRPKYTISELLVRPAEAIDKPGLETLLVNHPTGIRVLFGPQKLDTQGEISPSGIDLLFERLQGITDYVLINLPAYPFNAAEVVLGKSDFVVIVINSEADALASVEPIVASLSRLGIAPEQMATLIVDRDWLLPKIELQKIKPTIESNAGVCLLGIIPHEVKAPLELKPATAPIILSNPECPTASALREVAEDIVAWEIGDRVSLPSRSESSRGAWALVPLKEGIEQIPDSIRFSPRHS